jgi:hypothetical protein
LKSAFRKISGVRGLLGPTKWYLSEDCLLAAKRVAYSVEYRRFYLQDIESIVVWPSKTWIWRMVIPGVLFAMFGAMFWVWGSTTTSAVFTGIGVVWVGLELALGPTAHSSIRTTGAIVDLPLVARTRRARKVLAKIDAALRTARASEPQPSASSPIVSPLQAELSAQINSGGSASPAIVDAAQTNES